VELFVWVNMVLFLNESHPKIFLFRIPQDKNDFELLGNFFLKVFLKSHFNQLSPLYYRDANGAILVFDITDEDSFDRV
jgi:GTPase SAR1 family protein